MRESERERARARARASESESKSESESESASESESESERARERASERVHNKPHQSFALSSGLPCALTPKRTNLSPFPKGCHERSHQNAFVFRPFLRVTMSVHTKKH